MNLNINYNQITPLCEIMTRNRSDKGNTNLSWAWHHYTMFYYQLFKDIKDKQLRVFELGMGTTDPNIDSNMGPNGRPGASLFGWSEFFPNSAIFGADVDKKILFETDRIKTYYCDQTDAECIRQMWSHHELQENFDIIIDDGLHRYFSNECFFENSIHKLKENGFYIIEDINNTRDLPQLLEIVERWKNVYNQFNFELIKFPSHWNDYDNNIMLITKKREFIENKNCEFFDKINHECDDYLFITYSVNNEINLIDKLHKYGIKDEFIKNKNDILEYSNINKINFWIQNLHNFNLKQKSKYFIFMNPNNNNNIEKYIENLSTLQKFIVENVNDVFFLRENNTQQVNTDFFIIKNNNNLKYIISFLKNVLFTILNSENVYMENQLDNIINNLKFNINYDILPL